MEMFFTIILGLWEAITHPEKDKKQEEITPQVMIDSSIIKSSNKKNVESDAIYTKLKQPGGIDSLKLDNIPKGDLNDISYQQYLDYLRIYFGY